MVEAAATTFGGQSMVDPLRRVLVRSPGSESLRAWEAYGWLGEPDPTAAAREHEVFCALLRDLGCDVLVADPDPVDPDAIYACDPALTCDRGVVLLRPGKALRQGEPAGLGRDLDAFGIPAAGEMTAPATAEGGDTLWLDPQTLLVGRSYRTNDAGVERLRDLLPGVDVVGIDLPHADGPDSVLHLMSLLSPLDHDLMLAFVPLVPVRVMEMLSERSIGIVPVSDDEYATMGTNVLAVAPRVAVALEGNPRTRAMMERAGVEVHAYAGDEISLKGQGGPTCLTRPILRAT
jgi:N-dimethylarginine dimethylaminohydrolase